MGLRVTEYKTTPMDVEKGILCYVHHGQQEVSIGFNHDTNQQCFIRCHQAYDMDCKNLETIFCQQGPSRREVSKSIRIMYLKC